MLRVSRDKQRLTLAAEAGIFAAPRLGQDKLGRPAVAIFSEAPVTPPITPPASRERHSQGMQRGVRCVQAVCVVGSAGTEVVG